MCPAWTLPFMNQFFTELPPWSLRNWNVIGTTLSQTYNKKKKSLFKMTQRSFRFWLLLSTSPAHFTLPPHFSPTWWASAYFSRYLKESHCCLSLWLIRNSVPCCFRFNFLNVFQIKAPFVPSWNKTWITSLLDYWSGYLSGPPFYGNSSLTHNPQFC